MPRVESTERTNDFGLFGTLGKPYHFGERILGHYSYGDEEPQINKNEYGARQYGAIEYGEDDIRAGIYQRRHKNGKVTYTRLRFYTPSNPRTVPQQSWRANFTTGMTAWSNLTETQKKVYNDRAKSLPLHGVNIFLREYLNSI